jgi:hypothetical protein
VLDRQILQTSLLLAPRQTARFGIGRAKCWPMEWCLPAMETVPAALTVRWISTGGPAAKWAQDGRGGWGPLGRAF